MALRAGDDEFRSWCRRAVEVLAETVAGAPDALVGAYPGWSLRDLAVHVVRVSGNATIALRDGVLERPRPVLGVAPGDEPDHLADAVRRATATAEEALDSCPHEFVWTPVGPRAPTFWVRRLLREGVLHRWDAEQAVGHAPAGPGESCAIELIDEFLDTDVARALATGEHPRAGVVTLRAGAWQRQVDLTHAPLDTDVTGATPSATITADPAPLWLWLMRRHQVGAPVVVDDARGSAATFTDLIEGFNRPTA